MSTDTNNQNIEPNIEDPTLPTSNRKSTVLTPETVAESGSAYDNLPSYLVQANNHQIAATGDTSLIDHFKQSIIDPYIDGAKATVGGAVGGAIGGIALGLPGAVVGGVVGAISGLTDGHFVQASLASGANSFYNTAAAIANWGGIDIAQNDTQQFMESLDSDLGKYYADNKQSSDIAGFVATSLIPGTAALKAYNWSTKALTMAKGGYMGAGMSEATGLLIPTQGRFLAAAEAEINSSSAAFSYINTNSIRSVAAGIGEHAIQGAIFETAIAATMFKSPILDDMDVEDLGWNILHGAMFMGAVGAVTTAVKSSSMLKKSREASDIELMPFTHRNDLGNGANHSDKNIMAMEDRFNIPEPTPEQVTAYGNRPQQAGEAKRAGIANDVRNNSRAMSNGDDVVGNKVANEVLGMADTRQVGDAMLGLREVGNIHTVGKLEAEVEQIGSRLLSPKTTPAEVERVRNTNTRYLKVFGEMPVGGNILEDLVPRALGVVDKLIKFGQKVTVTPEGIRFGESKFIPVRYGLGKDSNKFWDVGAVTQEEAEARYLHAYHSDKLPDNATLYTNDLPALEKAYMESANTAPADFTHILMDKDGSATFMRSREDLLSHIIERKAALADELRTLQVPTGAKVDGKHVLGLITNGEIARRLNVTVGYLEKTKFATNIEDDVLANQFHAKTYNDKMSGLGYQTAKHPYDVLLEPQHVKLLYDDTPITDVTGNVLKGMAAIKQLQVANTLATKIATAGLFAEHDQYFFDLPDKITLSASSRQNGGGRYSFSNGIYGQIDAHMGRLGQVTHNVITARINKATEKLTPIFSQLRNNQGAALELSTTLNRIQNTPERYVLSTDGNSIVLRGVKVEEEAAAAYQEAQAAGTKGVRQPQAYVPTDPDAPASIPIISPIVRDFFAAHVELNGERIGHLKRIRSVQGLQDLKDPNTIYVPPVDPKLYPKVAFVIDKDITSTGHVKMIHAATDVMLDKLVSQVETGRFRVITKKDSEDFHKAYGDYQHDLTLHETYIDSALFNKGISTPYFPVTDANKLVDGLEGWHLEKERQLVREAVSTRYAKEIAELRKLSNNYTRLSTSDVGRSSISSSAQNAVAHDPYQQLIRTMLDKSNSVDASNWTTMNNFLDDHVSSIWNTLTNSIRASKNPADLDEINRVFQEAGINTGYYNAALHAYANHTAGKGALTNFVQRSNALMASVMLKPDVLQAANNLISMSILGGSEIHSIANAISKGNSSIVGELAGLTHLKVPGTNDPIFTVQKLIADAHKDWFDEAARLKEAQAGFTTRHTVEYHAVNEAFTITGRETGSQLLDITNKGYDKTMAFLDKTAKYTGNQLAEEYTRFITARVMRKLTTLASDNGLLDANLADSYIGAAVNRVNGNYLASQRPLMFQGPIGQAVGLFQTYQINFAQQMLRHLAEGSNKSVALAMGLQGTIYGMNGLPAFHAVNQYLVGQAEGNKHNKDLYSALYGSVNKEAAEWVMYGAGSSALGLFHPDLKVNLYSRGDINPRNLTILPTSFADIPIVSASTKFFGNLKEVFNKLNDGGASWTTLLQGLEHNGINRPLSGLAATLEGFTNSAHRAFTTKNSGELSASNDMLSLVTLGRIAGGKPLDEALALDLAYRSTAYQSRDTRIRKELSETVKSTMVGNHMPGKDQMDNFLDGYVKAGGDQKNFNKFIMKAYKSANTAQANALADKLKSPYSQGMQELLGGARMKDFTNTPAEPTITGTNK